MTRKWVCLSCLNNTPGHFSPNVILRPLYQEVILPNLCYIGGGGELGWGGRHDDTGGDQEAHDADRASETLPGYINPNYNM